VTVRLAAGEMRGWAQVSGWSSMTARSPSWWFACTRSTPCTRDRRSASGGW